jgi:hypothetical protein
MKVSPVPDPDTPWLHKAMRGKHHDKFLAAMGEEIAILEAHKTCTIIHKETIPTGSNLLHVTCALKTKCYPNGQMRKHKAPFCVRGDKQIVGIDYFESYAPVAFWSTIHMVMNIVIQ